MLEQMRDAMEFDIVLATRNRLPQLRNSLPLILAQQRLPERMIVVDASDDHDEAANGIRDIVERSGRDVKLEIHNTAAGSSRQRNCGLECVRAPVVFFPDDDSLWYPGVAENVMRVYERDAGEAIGAVCPTEAFVPPREGGGCDIQNGNRARMFLSSLMNGFEKTFFMDPIYIEGFSRVYEKPSPAWLVEEHAQPFGPMTGFQMSFRTDAIRACGFDENLGRYSLMEDRDASLHILREKLIVCCEKARVYHSKAPGKRTDDFEWGLINILNRGYVLCKHTPPGSPARRILLRYSLFRFAVYLLRAGTPQGRRRIQGAWKGIRALPLLITTPPEQARETYLQIRGKYLLGPG